MKKIGIITFHAAYNYGSLLQNFALQNTLRKLGFVPETINLRTRQQKEQYNYFTPPHELLDKRRAILYLFFLSKRKELLQKYALFERFLTDDLVLSKEVSDEDGVSDLPGYDAYIAGSDQIWNVLAKDFNWCYFLDFVKKNDVPRVSYAASMGTTPEDLCRDGNESIRQKVHDLLMRFTAISVRDERTASVLRRIVPEKECSVLPDPTLLLTTAQWEKCLQSESLVDKPYIFLYNPYYLTEVYKQAKELSRITGMKVVVSNINIKSVLYYPEFRQVLVAGPWQFLNLIKNADYVIGRSFHLLVFSILFRKKFVAVNGLEDSRLGNLLNLTGLQSMATEKNVGLRDVLDSVESVAWSEAFVALDRERLKAFDFIRRSLNF